MTIGSDDLAYADLSEPLRTQQHWIKFLGRNWERQGAARRRLEDAFEAWLRLGLSQAEALVRINLMILHTVERARAQAVSLSGFFAT